MKKLWFTGCVALLTIFYIASPIAFAAKSKASSLPAPQNLQISAVNLPSGTTKTVTGTTAGAKVEWTTPAASDANCTATSQTVTDYTVTATGNISTNNITCLLDTATSTNEYTATFSVLQLQQNIPYTITVAAADDPSNSATAQLPAIVPPTGAGYLQWKPPGTGPSYPLFAYKDNAQVAYAASPSLQYFFGAYPSDAIAGIYNFYYQNGSNWFGCKLVLSADGSIGVSTCPTPQIGQPSGFVDTTNNTIVWSTVWTISTQALAYSATTAPTVVPKPTDFGNRTITFVNNTKYSAITIGGSACNFILPYVTNQNQCADTPAINEYLAQIAQGASYQVAVGVNGLDSAAYYLTGYCTGSATDCAASSPSNDPKHIWVKTGGYGVGEKPYAVKIEATIMPVTNGVPSGASNIDLSAVDGYNFGVVLTPSTPQYCALTIPPEGSNLQGVGLYGPQAPLAQVVPTSDASLQQLCAVSSQLPSSYTGQDQPWNLSMLDPASKAFAGCMSPCMYATANVGTQGITQDDVNRFCCIGAYSTPGTCDVAAGQVGANTSTYVTNILSSSQFQNVYPFAYGDAGSDYGCPPETSFVVSFVSTRTPPPANTLTAPSDVAASSVTKTRAAISWNASTDTYPGAQVATYVVTATPPSPLDPLTAVVNAPATHKRFSGLTPNTTYSLTVTAIDNAKPSHSATSSPYSFTTQAENQLSAPTNLAATNISATGALISWDASTDTDPKAGTITYNVSMTPVLPGISFTQATTATSTAFNSAYFVPGDYTVVITATDQDNNIAQVTMSSPIKIPAASPPSALTAPANINATAISATGATISWDASTESPAQGTITYNVSVTPTVPGISFTQATTSTSTTFNSAYFVPGNYTVVVTATDQAKPPQSAQGTMSTPLVIP